MAFQPPWTRSREVFCCHSRGGKRILPGLFPKQEKSGREGEGLHSYWLAVCKSSLSDLDVVFPVNDAVAFKFVICPL